jgi:hypothetical protein
MMSEREFIIASIELNARTLKGEPACFAAGVNVAQVVDLVFQAKEVYPHFVQTMGRFEKHQLKIASVECG